ncbi:MULTISPECIES: hypothetical protein [Thiorhodovibrio]|uniref:hypothetical protein n=1 Tax=Thiorhodovibrio TaxID=61593 RepID=UPI001913A0EE|nr:MULTISPECIES: hypothetical protein [Thiorhodovibrio]WPL13332.1 hypothetical protein Thiosp_03131 [Thiorhodovibrio litoralis]
MKRKTPFYWVLLAFVTLGGLSLGCSTVAPNGKPASTFTAIDVINDQVEKGNVEIKGDPDAAPIP